MDEKPGTFLVTAADDGAAELADIDDGQVIALSSNPGLEAGELHALSVPPAETAEAVAEVVGDEETTRRAARLGASRAEVRGEDGVVAVRYLEG